MLGLPVLGDDGRPLLIALGSYAQRLAATARLGCTVPALVHPSAVSARSVEMAEGAVIMPRTALGALARIGRLVLVNRSAIIEHELVLEAGAHVAHSAVLCGGVHVGERDLIGARAVVSPHVRIGVGTIAALGRQSWRMWCRRGGFPRVPSLETSLHCARKGASDRSCCHTLVKL